MIAHESGGAREGRHSVNKDLVVVLLSYLGALTPNVESTSIPTDEVEATSVNS